MTFLDALHHAWLTDDELANFFKVSLSTVKRWKKSNKAPNAVIQSLKLIAGDCPTFSNKSGWERWAFSGGYLWSPELDKFTAGDIRASRLDREIIQGYERETARLKAEINDLKRLLDKHIVEMPVKTAEIIPFPTARTNALRLLD